MRRSFATVPGVNDATVRCIATTTTVLIYVQILLGATMRHTGAGLAIPDFPLMFGHWLPTDWDLKIAIHFAHRAGALVVALAILATTADVWYRHADRRELTRPAVLLVALVAVQLTLGALTVLSRRDVWINSAHVVCGALVLTTSLVLTLRTWRVKFASVPEPVRLKPDTATLRGAGLQACERGAEAPRHSYETRSGVHLEADHPVQADRPVNGARA